MSSPPGKTDKKSAPAQPRPSASVILISPKNEILLLHRVQTSSSFASAHVFPGGNLSAQDGSCPPAEDVTRHEDNAAYRRAAIRELFEESGILLAKAGKEGRGRLLGVGEEVREKGRKGIHRGEISFEEWLRGVDKEAVPDIDGLIPFTRWITPTNVPRRYTTQMYLYFLPLPIETENQVLQEIPPEGQEEEIQVPTSDGGVEITAATIFPASEWVSKARSGEIILFPPQYLLLQLVSEFLDTDGEVAHSGSVEELRRRRRELVEFVHSGNPPWTEKCISPKMVKVSGDGRVVLGLDHPGPELEGTERRGEGERVVLVKFAKGAARRPEVKWKRDVFEEDRKSSL